MKPLHIRLELLNEAPEGVGRIWDATEKYLYLKATGLDEKGNSIVFVIVPVVEDLSKIEHVVRHITSEALTNIELELETNENYKNYSFLYQTWKERPEEIRQQARRIKGVKK